MPRSPPHRPKSNKNDQTTLPRGWNDNVTESRIPQYDGLKDKHGGLAPKISPPKYTSSTKKTRPTTTSPTQEQQRASAKRQDSHGSIVKAPAHRGNITYEADMPGNGGMELDVLKAIILREDYISRLAELSRSESPYAVVGSMANTLDLIRLTTVEVVEAIATWRKRQTKHMPFKWNGINYLVKIPSDLDFLEECDVMRRWLGFSMTRNPFVMPENLDARSVVFEPGRPTSPSVDSDPFMAIGGIPVAPAVSTPSASTRSPPRQKTAYETRIINDDELVPRPKPVAAQTTIQGQPKPKTTFVLPSQIGDLDVLRIREAEKLLLEEEALCGRYKRDLDGRVVPEAVANQQAKTASIRHHHVATAPPSAIEPNQPPVIPVVRSSSANDAIIPSKGNEKLTGNIKQAGMLAPPTKLSMQGRLRMPMHRSRGAKMEEDLEKSIIANKQLEERIAALRDAISKAEVPSTEASDSPRAIDSDAALEKLKCDLASQVDQFERKKREIFRKQEAMEAFKNAQMTAVENARMAELLRRKQMDEAQILAEKTKLVQIHMATKIQKIVRGVIARREYKTIRIRYTIASTYIEAVVRGFLARRRVYKLFARRKAAIQIQRMVRGLLARNATRLERLAQKQRRASVVIQKMYRGRLGRKRMKNYRALISAKLKFIYLTEHLSSEELAEMGRLLCAYAKHPESKYTIKPSHVVLGLVRILKSSCESCLCNEDQQRLSLPIHEVRWMEGGQYLRRARALLRTLHTIATSAGRLLLPLSAETLALMRAYKHDCEFTLEHFSMQGVIAKTTSTLFQMIQALNTISEAQHIFLPPKPFLAVSLAEYADDDRAESNKCDLEDHHSDRQFVPLALIQDCPSRPRPLLIVLSRDVPGYAKELLVNNMMTTFPGLFLRINTPSSIHINTIQQTFNAGYSVLFDADIGLSIGQQRKFLGQFSIVSKALRPTPLSIMIQGSLGNRVGPQGTLGVSDLDLRLLFDGEAKRHAQLAANGLLALTDGSMFDEMIRTSQEDCPHIGLVLVMEAILILLTPTQRYTSPESATSAVTWRLSRRLLAAPQLFADKLLALDLRQIPADNTMVLKEYIEHGEWPVVNTSHGSLMYRLALYTHAIISFAIHTHRHGGCAMPISRSKPLPGLFSSVITVTDPTSYDPQYKVITAKLACAILEDVRVYRESKKINDRYHIITLYRDCHRVYVSCYDPLTSNLWKADIPETDMNALLAPNSIEVLQNKKPPKNPKELYKQIVGYCALSKPKGKDPTVQLELRPRARRLCRHARKIHGHFATITVSEMSLGHLRLDVHVHDTYSAWTSSWAVHVNDDELQYLKMNATDPIEWKAYDEMDVEIMHRYVLDRLQVEHSCLTLPFIHRQTAKPPHTTEAPAAMRVRVRKHGGSGRFLLRQVVVSPLTKVTWVVSVFEITWTRALRLEAYRPDTSEAMKLNITYREREELLLSSFKRQKKRPRPAAISSPLWLQCILNRVTIANDAIKLDTELDSGVFQLCYFPDIYSSTEPKVNRSVRIIFRVVLVHLTNDEDVGLHLFIYLPRISATHLLVLSDSEVQSIVDIPWPCTLFETRQRAIRALLPCCVYDTNEKLVRLENAACFVKYSTLVSPVIQVAPASPQAPQEDEPPPEVRPLTPADLDLLHNTVLLLDGVDKLVLLYDIAKQLHSGSYKCNGTLLVVTATMTAYLKHIVEPNKPGLPDIHRSIDCFDLALEIYHPEISRHCVVHIDGMQDLREVTGPDQAHLIGSNTFHEWLHHIMTNRLDRSISDDGTFTVSLVRSRLYSQYKATPVNTVMEENAVQNDHLLIDQRHKRGVKLLSKAKHILGHAVIFTVFDLTEAPEDAARRALHVHLRLDGYIAATSQKLSIWVRDAVLVEAVGSHVELLEAGNEQALAQHLIDLMDLEMAVDNTTVERLFVKEIVVAPSAISSENDSPRHRTTPRTSPPCLFKTFRTVGGEKVLMSIRDTSAATPDLPLRIDFYQPSSSLSTFLDVPKPLLKTLVATEPSMWTDKAQVQAALQTLLSFVSVSRVESECGTLLQVEWKTA
ncbi:unnamed protein product [Aphanomyces euteiches]